MSSKSKRVMTDGKMILAWRATQKGEDRGVIADKYDVSSWTIVNWCKKVEADPTLLEVAQSNKKVMPNADNISNNQISIRQALDRNPESDGTKQVKPRTRTRLAMPSVDEGLKDENKFLRWWCEGERRGYVDRLLSQIQED